MSVDGFIPEIWTARLLGALQHALVAGQPNVINRDYEGEISQKGDTVQIGSIGAITVKTYTKNTDIDAPETLDDDMQQLTISEADYFNFQVDDVDARQAAPNLMDGAMADAAYRMKDKADKFILGKYGDIDAGNVVDAGLITDPEAAYEALVDLGVVLDEADVPTDGRFVIIPPFFHGLLLKDDRFVKSGVDAAAATLKNGQVGEAAGFTILKSNNVKQSGGDYQAIGGVPAGWSYAEQINKVEAFRPERRFGDAVKGLHLYGAKVVRPTALALLKIQVPGS